MADGSDTLRILVTDSPVWADAGPVRAPLLLVPHAVPVVDIALIDVVALLTLPHGKVEARAFEPVAAVVSFWAGPAPEASDGVVAGHRLVARVRQVAFVHIRAGGAVASQAC